MFRPLGMPKICRKHIACGKSSITDSIELQQPSLRVHGVRDLVQARGGAHVVEPEAALADFHRALVILERPLRFSHTKVYLRAVRMETLMARRFS